MADGSKPHLIGVHDVDNCKNLVQKIIVAGQPVAVAIEGLKQGIENRTSRITLIQVQ
jgi:hypothetical protein